jgi:hypothetical protein
MKTLTIALGLIMSLNTFAADTTLICSDQNSHGTYQLVLSQDLSSAQLVTAISDSSVLAAGTRVLKFEEGESSRAVATYAGRSNLGLQVALLLNAQKATSLRSSEILEVTAYYQLQKGGMLSGNTTLLCSRR